MYLVYLPDVGGPSEPLIQKHVGRGSSCIADDQEEDQSRNPRRRRAYDCVAGTEHLEVRHDRRIGQRPVELAPLASRRARGIAPLHSWRILRSSPTVNDSRDVRSSSLLAAAPTRRIMSIVAASVAGLRTYV